MRCYHLAVHEEREKWQTLDIELVDRIFMNVYRMK